MWAALPGPSPCGSWAGACVLQTWLAAASAARPAPQLQTWSGCPSSRAPCPQSRCGVPGSPFLLGFKRVSWDHWRGSSLICAWHPSQAPSLSPARWLGPPASACQHLPARETCTVSRAVLLAGKKGWLKIQEQGAAGWLLRVLERTRLETWGAGCGHSCPGEVPSRWRHVGGGHQWPGRDVDNLRVTAVPFPSPF